MDGRIADNDLLATRLGVLWVWAADGSLDGLVVSGNRVRGFHVGIQVGDRVELHGQTVPSRLLVSDNRVLDSKVAGILVSGEGVDVAGNEVRNAGNATTDLLKDAGLFYVGVHVAGRGVRVRQCWIELPALAKVPSLGVVAGILVGEGLDDGRSSASDIYDVEVSDNRIEGAGAGTPAAGVLLGGPHAVLDVRVRGNVIRNLGDAAIRLLGTGHVSRRIRIEDNRIEQVALAEALTVDTATPEQLDLLAPGLRPLLAGIDPTKPAPLLEALLKIGDRSDLTRAAVDAVLRWIERLSLRGAIVACRAEDTEVTGNRIIDVGLGRDRSGPRDFPAEVRTAGIAVVGGSNVLIDDNRVESVRAPVITRSPAALPGKRISLPVDRAIAALKSVALEPEEAHRESAELHAAAAGAHRLLLDIAVTKKDPAVTGVLGALDAIADALFLLHETDLGQTLLAQIAPLRAAPLEEARPQIADALRVHIAHVARITAASEVTTAAWMALEDLEGALVPLSPARIAEVAADLAKHPSVLDNLPPGRRADLAKVLETLSTQTSNTVSSDVRPVVGFSAKR
ncbi:MAG: hypothetical protein U0359_39670 [Byssovorax sp.]